MYKCLIVAVPLVTAGVAALTPRAGPAAVPLDRVRRTAVAQAPPATDRLLAQLPYVSVFRPYRYVSVYRYGNLYGNITYRDYRYGGYRVRGYRFADFPYRDYRYGGDRYRAYRYGGYRPGGYRYGGYRYFSTSAPASGADAVGGGAE